MITGDFETRSEADLKKVGAYEYARHESTEIVCLGYQVDDERQAALWTPGFEDLSYKQAARKRDRTRRDIPCSPDPVRLHRRIVAGDTFEAHNAWFERCIWYFQLHLKLGWPMIPDDQWRCSAALAASYSLPRKLEKAVLALGLSEQKDMAGHRVMMKLSKPRNPTKGDPDSKWHQKRCDLLTTFRYNLQDVRAEYALSQQLRPLPAIEQEVWQLDQKINWRGLHYDRSFVEGALEIGAECEKRGNEELEAITYGCVERATQKIQFLDWLEAEGVEVPHKFNRKKVWTRTTEGEQLVKLLDEDLAPHVHRAIEVWLSVNQTSTKKYIAFQRRAADTDDRIRETLRYHGASTGRWAGVGIQPQNMSRNVPKNMPEIVEDVRTGDYDLVSILYDCENVQGTLKSIIRGAVTAGPGNELVAVDFEQVEARGVFWVSGHTEGLEAFEDFDSGRREGDIYCWQAEGIFNHKVTKDMDERQSGKVVVLGAGYQMGWPKLITYAAKQNVTLTDEEAKLCIDGYRSTNWPVVNFWKACQRRAIQAIETPGVVVEQGDHIRWGVQGRFLHCRLPSGRLLSWLDPRVEWKPAPWDEEQLIRKITFMGEDTYTRQWKRCDTYGGKLTENIVQALCRDLMRDGMLSAEKAGYPLVLTVHDEIVSEVPKGRGDLDEFIEIVTELPDWAEGFPLKAGGFITERYRK